MVDTPDIDADTGNGNGNGNGDEIAIIGMAGRFPGAPDVPTLWQNLCAGVESISFFSDSELEISPFLSERMRAGSGFVPAGGVLDDADAFDHAFFGLTRRQARWMDPQQRVYLQVAWAALEDAGYDPERFADRISVYAGASSSGHQLTLLNQLANDPNADPASLYEGMGSASAENLATTVSFQLRLRGESMNVHTACSTGLAAVHLACQSLLMGQSRMALAGAVRIAAPQRTGYVSQEGMILSPDGHCRAFGRGAAGTVPSNGAGAVLLKPLADALADRDHIYAVIKGSAINNEGRRSVGYTAPSVSAQAEVVAEALAFAGVSADEIGYLEAHGTGTPLGDPIEVAALTQAYRRGADRAGHCRIGSVKSNIGHLDTAAGIAGLIKAALAVRHGEIPPSLHARRPNPAIDFAGSPFVVAADRQPWPADGAPRRAGVSSFGIGGTNVHAILEQAPGPTPDGAPSTRPHQVVTLAADTPAALSTMARQLADRLATEEPGPLADVAYTRAMGRAARKLRRAHVARDLPELIAALRHGAADGSDGSDGSAQHAWNHADARAAEPRVALLFPGQGAASHGMAAPLYHSEPVFRGEVDRCLAELEPRLGRTLLPLLLEGAGPITDLELAHPALFAVEHALARLWLSWGVRPVGLLGHSFGEYAAACVAGVLSLPDAADLVIARGSLAAELPEGRMLAVGLDEASLQPYLEDGLSLAAVNGDGRCVVAGSVDHVSALRSRLSAEKHASALLPVRHAFHSPDVDPLLARLQEAAAQFGRTPPTTPVVSSLTGQWWTDDEPGSGYWARQMREPVRFGAALRQLAAGPHVSPHDGPHSTTDPSDASDPYGPLVLIEAGPDQALTALARAQLGKRTRAVPSLPRVRSSAEAGHRVLMEAVGAVWRAGAPVDWTAFYQAERRWRVPLPAYPFAPVDCSLQAPSSLQEPPAAATVAAVQAAPPQAAPPRTTPPQHASPEAVPQPSDNGDAPAPIRTDGPRDEVERAVFAIWQERLGEESFGIHDNFLELGGNSLTAAQMLTRLREAFSPRIPLSALFEAPTVAGMAERIRDIDHGATNGSSPASGSSGTDSAGADGSGRPSDAPVPLPPITSEHRDGALALSVVQARTLALHAADPDNPALAMPIAVLMEGVLDVAALRRSIQEVTRRHEALRTTCRRGDDGGWIAQAAPSVEISLEIEVLVGEELARQRAREEAARPFDLADSPLRVRLLQIADDRHVLLLTVHHVVCDTLSLANFTRETAACYQAFLTGTDIPLAPLAAQYADFAAWQRRILGSGALKRQQEHWREALADLPPPLALPSDRPRSSEHGVRSGQLQIDLPTELSARVADLSQQLGVTPFVTLLAGYAALLSRVTGGDDIVVGTPIGNRDRAALEPLIGYVAHTLPLRVDLRGDPRFTELAGRCQAVLLSAYAHPDLPYEEVVAEVRPDLDPGSSRIFDAMFVLHSGLPQQQATPGGAWRLWPVPDMPAMFGATLASLSLMFGESPDGYAGALEYAEELFDKATAERLLEQLTALLDDATRRPEVQLSELRLAPPESEPEPAPESEPAEPEPESLLSRWLRATQTHPNDLAVIGDDVSMTWSELAACAGQTATALRGHGAPEAGAAGSAADSGAAVWLDLPPSARRIAALLGALWAGRPVAMSGLTGIDPQRDAEEDPRESLRPAPRRLDGGLPPPDLDLPLPGQDHVTPDTPALLEPTRGGDGSWHWRTWSHRDTARHIASLESSLGTDPGTDPDGAPSRNTGVLATEEPLTAPAALDLLWALCTGRTVRVAPHTRVRTAARTRWRPPAERDPRSLQLSLSYFANDEDSLDGPKYQLLLDGVRLADTLGFAAVWTPERHFHAFGGLYPSPTATSAALAAASTRVGIRAGSVVLPLHDPIRVAEDWAVIDNLSGGRVGVSFASGWHPDDFVLAPDRYADRREAMLDGIDTVRRLWRGEAVTRRNGAGEQVEIAIRPHPVQPELPFWVTAAGSPETFRVAGQIGGFVLTNLMAQSMDDLADKIALYREAWRDAGHDGDGHITLMLHAFLAENPEQAYAQVRAPLMDYFRSSVDIARGFAASQGLEIRPEDLSPDDLQTLLEHGLERYLQDGGLFGDPASCVPVLAQVRTLGVDEVAALIDFGAPHQETLRSVELLADLAARESSRARAAADAATQQTEAHAKALGDWIAEQPVGVIQATQDLLAWLAEAAPECLAGRTLLASDSVGPSDGTAVSSVSDALREVTMAADRVDARVMTRCQLPDGRWLAARTRLATPSPGYPDEPLAVPPGPGSAARVRDAQGRELGIGIVGELTLGGVSTGHRARWRPDGQLDLLPPPRAGARPWPSDSPAAPGPDGPDSGIRPVGRNRPLPLSYAQQRLWSIDQLTPQNIAYHNAVALRMRGTLDVSALHRALQEVTRRHEVLRTTFDFATRETTADADSARQVIHPSVEVALPVREVASDDRHVPRAEVLRLAAEHARQPFDLSHGPLLRACLLRLTTGSEQEHVLLVNMHHIVSDGWSAGVLFTELAMLYGAFSAGAPSPLPPLAVQYADYAVWQRGQRDTPAIAAELAYWTETLADLPMLELPADRPRAPVQSQRGAREPVGLDADLTAALRRLCRDAGVTPYAALHAGLAALLHRHSGQTDVAIGTATAGRNRPETEALIGCFINSVVVRTDLSGDPSFRELLARVSDAALGAIAHQEAPFERLVDELRAPRDLSHSPLFQAMLVLHNTPSPRAQLGDLTLEELEIDPGAAKLDLVLELREEPEGIAGRWEYNTDLFDAATIRQLTQRLRHLLQDAVRDPDQRLSELSLMSDAERHAVLDLSIAAPPAASENAAPEAEELAHAGFQAQAARTPWAVALGHPEHPVTYAELDARANRIAHGLRARGMRPGRRAALLIDDPIQAIGAMLGVLKAGGAYVPLDPRAPRARRDALLRHAAPTVVLCSEDVRLPGAILVLSLDEVADGQPSTPPPLAGSPDDPAYVIFTSGSTGAPKGVVVEHRQLVFSTRARQAHYGRDAGGCLCLYPLSFDGSVGWIYYALLSGGALWQPSAEEISDPLRLATLIDRHQLDRVAGVPTLHGHLLTAAPPGSLSSLRSVTVGGEACSPDLARGHAELLDGVELHNEYGPTEGTVWCTAHRVDSPPDGRVPIGRPIPGARAYVLDPHGRPLPVGAAGELHVGGPGVARGYLNDPGLTRERFIPDHLSGPDDAGAAQPRLYRTGDRVRWSRDGVLEFLGRMDRQVKIRGFRVEPAEIEAALAAHPAVAEAAVILFDGAGAAARLVGYLTPTVGETVDTVDVDAVRDFVRDRLPDYLASAQLVALATLPRTRHGKLDVRALPAPELAAADAAVAPRTDLERVLADVVATVLGLRQVGVHDNFFDIGGDSILAINAVTRAREHGVDLTVKQLFQNPTVARLATSCGPTGRPTAPERAATEPAAEPTAAEPALAEPAVVGPAPLTPIQRWFFATYDREPGEPQHFNMAVQLELSAPVRAEELQQAFRAVLGHHDALRLRFTCHEGEWRQHHAPDESEWTLDHIDLSTTDPSRHADLLWERADQLHASLRLDRGPLLRAALIDRGAGAAQRLLIAAHHLVIDGVSWRIVLADLFTACRQLSKGTAVALPTKTSSYAQWSKQVQGYAASAQGRVEREHWTSLPWRLAPRLPRDFPGSLGPAGPHPPGPDPRITEAAARLVWAELDVEETAALLREAPATHQADVHAMLLTAVSRAVAGWTGADHVQLDVERHGREDLVPGLDVSRTVGWFSDFHPVVLPSPHDATPAERLAAVAERLRAVPHHGAGYVPLRHGSEQSAEAAGDLTPAGRADATGGALADVPPSEITVNYLGQLDLLTPSDAPARALRDTPGRIRADSTVRPYLIEVTAGVLDRRMWFAWTYAENVHSAETIEGLAGDTTDTLRELIIG